MTAIQTLQKQLKKQIDSVDDKSLRIVKAILDIEQEEAIEASDNWLEEVSVEEMAAIKKGLSQLDKGEGIPHNEAIKQLKWFPK